jgi:hypothetical protein
MVSGGTSTFAEDADARDAVEPRGLKFDTDDLFDTAPEVRADLVEVLAGIFSASRRPTEAVVVSAAVLKFWFQEAGDPWKDRPWPLDCLFCSKSG